MTRKWSLRGSEYDKAWDEYDSAAEYLAKRGRKGLAGEALPEGLSDRTARLIDEDPEAFARRVREYAYAQGMESTERGQSRPGPGCYTDWHEAHRAAQEMADSSGLDVGIRASDEYGEKGFYVGYLPRPENRYGRDAMAEVVPPMRVGTGRLRDR